MNKNRLFVLLKILIVAVLLGVIFFAIDWRDHYQIVSVEGEPVETVYGRIIGRWDQDPVRFVTEISNTPRNVYRSEASSGRTIVMKPGILTYFANVDFGWFGLGAAAFLVFVVVINSRWWWLMRVNGLGVGFLEAQRFAWIGIFCSNVLPGATGGDVVKAVYIIRRCSGDRVRAVVSVVVDRILGLLSLLFVCSIFSVGSLERFPYFTWAVWACALSVLVIAVLLLSPKLRSVLRFEKLVGRLPDRIGTIVTELDDAVLQYRDHLKGIGLWILVSPLTYSLFCGSVFLMDRALGVGLELSDYWVIVPVAAVAQAIPIAPAGWGIGEAAYGALVGKFGAAALPGIENAEQMMRTRGVALSVLHRTHVVVWSLIGGILLLIDRQLHPSDDPLKAKRGGDS
tara:strand:+ start:259 stop:1452 length:1194 start_codon:yes stop_codon:yes gene_type:complete